LDKEVDWSSLHKTLSDTTRRSILELLAEKESLGYTEIMTLLVVTNTGRLNYHLKALGSLISKDSEGKYRLTERGRLAASLLKTFPERVPVENKQPALKVAVAVVLILVGILIIVMGVAVLVFSSTGAATISTHASMSSQVIPQNMSISITSLNVLGGSSTISWTATGPIHVYVLNSTQYGALLLQHSAGGQTPPILQNFTGAPTSWVAQYYQQTGNVSLTLPQGQYYFFAGSITQAVLDTFEYTQVQPVAGSSLPPSLLPGLALTALGVLLIILAYTILTRRVWR